MFQNVPFGRLKLSHSLFESVCVDERAVNLRLAFGLVHHIVETWALVDHKDNRRSKIRTVLIATKRHFQV